MRAIIQSLLADVHPDLTSAQVITAQVLQGSAVTDQPPFPFVVHKYSVTTPTPSRRGRNGLEVWVYDAPGSYLRIDAILQAIKIRFAGYPHAGPGGYIAVVDWASDSADLPAEEFHGITRMSAFNLVGSTT